MLYRVVTRSFVAGFVVRNGRVAIAAPILRRKILGKTDTMAIQILKREGYEVTQMFSNARTN